mmetsp:Transcript_41707/g.120859  ORF Transcript_41707/g.120859 Transcript_41707/m.120859 type:complete len:214 (-) Transcript_41707:174-815(-)
MTSCVQAFAARSACTGPSAASTVGAVTAHCAARCRAVAPEESVFMWSAFLSSSAARNASCPRAAAWCSAVRPARSVAPPTPDWRGSTSHLRSSFTPSASALDSATMCRGVRPKASRASGSPCFVVSVSSASALPALAARCSGVSFSLSTASTRALRRRSSEVSSLSWSELVASGGELTIKWRMEPPEADCWLMSAFQSSKTRRILVRPLLAAT